MRAISQVPPWSPKDTAQPPSIKIPSPHPVTPNPDCPVPGHVRRPLDPRPHPHPHPASSARVPVSLSQGLGCPRSVSPAARGDCSQEAGAANRRPFYNPLVTHNRPAPAAKAPASPPSRLFLEPPARKTFFFLFKGKVENKQTKKSPALRGSGCSPFPSSGVTARVFSHTVDFPDPRHGALFLKETHSNAARRGSC